MRTLACCHRAREISLDFDQADPRVTTYSGLESCILNHGGYSCETEYSASQASDSQAGDELSCSSSSKGEDSFASSSPGWPVGGGGSEEECGLLAGDWAAVRSPYPFYRGRRPPRSSEDKEKVPIYSMGFADVESMKEKFARLLLGEDGSGGRRGVATAVALSNAISNLAVGTFGELWKLEPLPGEKKSRWRREMDWLLSPTNYMVELVPAKQSGANGRMLEIMTPRARADVHTTLPALQKLDSILIEVLDSMTETEFWYAEGGSRTVEGKAAQGGGGGGGVRPGKRWWLPSPRVPESGLSLSQRKKLGFQGKCVYQVMKAVKSINEQILLQIPLPDAIRDALPKSGKVGLGEDLERLVVSSELCSVEEIFRSLDLSSEHGVLDVVNRLEGAAFAWRERLSGGVAKKGRRPWAAIAREGGAKPAAKIGVSLERAEALLHLLRDRFPNLPQTFFAVAKIRSNKDVGHAIVEAYSRVLGNLAFCILARIGDVLQEDDLHQPISTAAADLKFELSSEMYLGGASETPPGYIKRALIDQMNMADGRLRVADVIKRPRQLFPEKKKIADVPGESPHCQDLPAW